tara:strand:+ start:381 stop:608 length:228 start_codon:yes stop_codon:yes gene_type:complete
MIASYVRNDNNNIVMLLGSRRSYMCRQREYNSNGETLKDTKESLRFISFKESQKIINKKNKIIYGPLVFDSLSRL